MKERAKIVLLAATGLTGQQIAEQVGCSEPTVIKWRRRYAQDGLDGIKDAPRPGGHRTALTDEVISQILLATTTPPGVDMRALGATQWSTRRVAAWLAWERRIAVSHDSVARVWRGFGLARHDAGGFVFGTNPTLDAGTYDPIGLYVHPLHCAVALRHARGRRPHRLGDLSAALVAATAQPAEPGDCRHQEFLRFLRQAARSANELRVVCDDAVLAGHGDVQAWLLHRPRVTMHVTSGLCSLRQVIEYIFLVTNPPDSYCRLRDLADALASAAATWHTDSRAFTWISPEPGTSKLKLMLLQTIRWSKASAITCISTLLTLPPAAPHNDF